MLLNGVAGRAVHVAHQCPFFAHQHVQQRAFASVRFADDGHGNAAFQRVAQFETLAESPDVLRHLLGQLQQVRAVGKLDVLVVGEVQFQFEHRGYVYEFLAQAAQFVAEVSL